MAEHDKSIEQNISGPGAVGVGRDLNGLIITGSGNELHIGDSINFTEALRLRFRQYTLIQEKDLLIEVLLEFPATHIILHHRVELYSMVEWLISVHNPRAEGAHDKLQRLEATLDRCIKRAPGIKHTHLHNLFRLLHRTGIGIEHISIAYGNLGLNPAFYQLPSVREGIALLAAVIEQLSTCPVQIPDNTHALLDFAHMFLTAPVLANHPGIQAEQDNLKYWISTVAQAMQIPNPLHKTDQPEQQDTSAVLLIRVESDVTVRKDLRPVQSASFRLNAWVGDVQMFADGHPNPVGEPYTCSLDEIPQKISDTIEQTYSDYSHLHIDAVEVVLPWYLLLHSVDQCEVSKGVFSCSVLGAEHHTIVRILERVQPFYRDRLRSSWRTKWHTYQEWSKWDRSHQLQHQTYPSHEEVECALARFASPDCHRKTIQKILSQSHTFGMIHAFALKERMTPDNASHILLESLEGVQRTVIEQMVDSGIPIALCIRGSGENHITLLKEIEALLTEYTMSELRDKIKAHRLDSLDAIDIGNMDHLGLHLTLLWDDPDRLPPDIQPFQDATL
jgi:hypothetical protein